MASLLEYMVALQYMGRVLQSPPDVEFLEATGDIPAEFANWPVFAGLDAECLAKPESVANIATFQKRLAEDHLLLFSGPEAIAPPWESVWRERDKLLFGECTAQVASLYADWALAIIDGRRQPEDHLGLEISFLAWLLQNKLEHPGILAQSGQTLDEAIAGILNGHILEFAPQVLEKAAANATTAYYAAVCKLCMALLEGLRSDIN